MSTTPISFEDYPFDTDTQWLNKLRNITFSQADPSRAILKQKQRYYKKNINSNYIIPTSLPTDNIDGHIDASISPEPSSPTTTTASAESSSRENQQEEQQIPSYDDKTSTTSPPPSATTTTTNIPLEHSRVWLLKRLVPLTAHFIVLFSSIIMAPAGFFFSRNIIYRLWLLAIFSSLFISIYRLGKIYGLPKFNKAYLFTIMMNPETHMFIGTFIFLSASPLWLALIPSIVRSLLAIARSLNKILPIWVPSSTLYPRIGQSFKDILRFENELLNNAAISEIITGFALVISLFINGFRNFSFSILIVIFVHWQILRVKSMMVPRTQMAFYRIRVFFDGYLLSPHCPKFMTSIYSIIITKMQSYADPNQFIQAASQ